MASGEISRQFAEKLRELTELLDSDTPVEELAARRLELGQLGRQWERENGVGQ